MKIITLLFLAVATTSLADTTNFVGTVATREWVEQNASVPNVSATGSVVRIGANATTATTNSVALGHEAKATGDGATAISPLSEANGNGALSVGRSSSANGKRAIAIGDRAAANGQDAIQIGNGTNTDTNSLNVLGFKLMKPDGTIPHERVTGLSNGEETRSADSLFKIADNQNVIWKYVYGESVWIAVTNYMRTVQGNAPSFQLWEVRDGNTNCVYWSAEEIDIRAGDKIDVAVSNVAHYVATSKADRAWSKYQSMTGEDNPQPNDITIVSTPSVMLSGGYEWQRFVDSGNEVWLLKCNNPMVLGADSTNAYFKITDIEGNVQFSIEKTASRLVDIMADSVNFTSDGNSYFTVSFQCNVQPILYTSLDIKTEFLETVSTENGYGLSCEWTNENGIYTATIKYDIGEGRPSKMFAFGRVMQEGKTVVKHGAPSSFDGGIIIGDKQYTSVGTAVIDGKTVLTLEGGQAVSE